jgi:predicted dehydrogenase/threonine dehydrogenase-like Zn-dependent dehydrogenase
MKQVSQQPRTGEVTVADVPAPELPDGYVLVRTRYSLISAGTERSKIELGRKSLIEKARARPDLVRKVVDRARVEGARSALAVARDRLDARTPVGYSSAGIVERVGRGVEGVSPRDRVACGGGGFANHAELVAVPQTLVARVPDTVDLADAAYATVGAIALHAVRQAGASVGEHVGVIGLGLVGQLAVRLLSASGCFPVGIDPDPQAVAVAGLGGARGFLRGEPTLEQAVAALTGQGLDAVLVCAASSSSDPLDLAVSLARGRATIVIVGDVPVTTSRERMYRKELELKIARSYGPGRYDRSYEEHGRDYPIEYVRWTEQRNMQAFVDLIAAGRIAPSDLTTHRFPLDRAPEAYATLLDPAAETRAFGVLLEYGEEAPHRTAAQARPSRRASSSPRIGLIGAGAFARSVLLPALSSTGATLAAVATSGGLGAADVAARYGIERAVGVDELLAADDLDAVVIATRHDSHAALTAQALRAGKAVFVEKPLALSVEELDEVSEALGHGGPLMVGFNRRYAPFTARLRAALAQAPAPVLTVRVNAGPLARDHWLNDLADGGGRLLGEGCHFVDLLAHLAGSRPVSAYAVAAAGDHPLEGSDSFVGTFAFANGALGSLVYTGAGDPRLPKERVEAFGGGVAGVIDDFRRLELLVGGKRSVEKARQDKGHKAELAAFVAAVAGQAPAPEPESYFVSTRATLALAESLRSGLPIPI